MGEQDGASRCMLGRTWQTWGRDKTGCAERLSGVLNAPRGEKTRLKSGRKLPQGKWSKSPKGYLNTVAVIVRKEK
ncbi:hypothetical protein RRG08_035126 [Elysia crispata]|uniref:Uncharacterized protein n=1 Tax=Elysia crispata TaxID=231223 RepID=A0AAE1ALM3_9GAST|nr:hypothetical protein RRG08_035126 [Elysia crispata]